MRQLDAEIGVELREVGFRRDLFLRVGQPRHLPRDAHVRAADGEPGRDDRENDSDHVSGLQVGLAEINAHFVYPIVEMKRQRGLGEDGRKFTVLCYFTRLLSSGMDDAKSFSSESDALKFAKKCVKDGKGSNPHAVVQNPYGSTKTVKLTKTGRLQTR